jgi:hypothetical protein
MMIPKSLAAWQADVVRNIEHTFASLRLAVTNDKQWSYGNLVGLRRLAYHDFCVPREAKRTDVTQTSFRKPIQMRGLAAL